MPTHEVQKMEMDPAKEKRTISETHSYSCKNQTWGKCVSWPNTPSKGQPTKKQCLNSTQAASKANEPTLAEVQENIIRIISGKINEKSDQIEDVVKENSTKSDPSAKHSTQSTQRRWN